MNSKTKQLLTIIAEQNITKENIGLILLLLYDSCIHKYVFIDEHYQSLIRERSMQGQINYIIVTNFLHF